MEWIARLEHEERERTGINNLKVGFNKVFGYYLEITKSNYDRIPDDYIRKQSLKNAERFITPELKQQAQSQTATTAAQSYWPAWRPSRCSPAPAV